jgi:hypothetical protein
LPVNYAVFIHGIGNSVITARFLSCTVRLYCIFWAKLCPASLEPAKFSFIRFKILEKFSFLVYHEWNCQISPIYTCFLFIHRFSFVSTSTVDKLGPPVPSLPREEQYQ